jgi:hypothetical protein
MHSLSNSLFGSQENYWRGAVGGPYSSLQPLSGMPGTLPNSAYSPYDQYSSHHAVTGRSLSSSSPPAVACVWEGPARGINRRRRPHTH